MKNSNYYRLYGLMIIILLSLICSFPIVCYAEVGNDTEENKYIIYVDVNAKQLQVFDKELQDFTKVYPIASGRKNDPSPLGTWVITDKGRKKEKYFGTRWMGLSVTWGGYGIHGTDRPGSIGYSASHGCFRMRNKDIEELYNYIAVGTVVIVEKGPYGPFGDGFRVIKPGDFGSDVWEVQRLMKAQGYFPGFIDGIYKPGMVRYVLKFRERNNLKITNDIDDGFYRALGVELMD